MLALAIAAAWASGCADSVKPPRPQESDPETELTYAPVQNDSTYFRVHLYWSGTDHDGEVTGFRFATDADTTLPVTQWRQTTAHDTTLAFPVDPVRASALHAFMISAVDNAGRMDQSPAKRVFSTRTIPPTSQIVSGPGLGSDRPIPTAFTFQWSGIDPDAIEAGHSAPVDSFEYLLLKVGASVAPGHPLLPSWDPNAYVTMINRSTGNSLPPPYDDWEWKGVRGQIGRFFGIAPGEYVFVERAVDVAGAAERSLQFPRNIRHFTVADNSPSVPAGPILTVASDVAQFPFTAVGSVDDSRVPVQSMEGDALTFSWSATAAAYGGHVTGYSYALDDTSTLPALSLANTRAAFTPAQLTAGSHTLYVRAADDLGLVTNAVIPLFVVHAAFKDPGAPREVLYVDDSQSPGAVQQRVGNFPSDAEETDWWTLTLLPRLGVPYTEWDTYLVGIGDVEGRKAPELRDLARYSTVIWNVDLNNGVSSPTALYKTLVGDGHTELASYLRAGGTLILSGMSIGSNICEPRSTLYSNLTRGICSGLEAGSSAYTLAYFPRNYMGIDGARPSDQGLRTLGARDFIAAYPTAAGIAAGLDTAEVDRGDLGSGAKWITYPGTGNPNTNMSPGLPAVDGWNLAADFGCEPDPSAFAPENAARPISEAILTYHGTHVGINEEGGPSPREGMVAGIRVQAHRPAPIAPTGNYGDPPPTFDPNQSIGRIVVLSFPLYFLRDDDAIRILTSAYSYVSASPTLH
jgi:hypothetical protein